MARVPVAKHNDLGLMAARVFQNTQIPKQALAEGLKFWTNVPGTRQIDPLFDGDFAAIQYQNPVGEEYRFFDVMRAAGG
jgi:hypothetical protein